MTKNSYLTIIKSFCFLGFLFLSFYYSSVLNCTSHSQDYNFVCLMTSIYYWLFEIYGNIYCIDYVLVDKVMIIVSSNDNNNL